MSGWTEEWSAIGTVVGGIASIASAIIAVYSAVSAQRTSALQRSESVKQIEEARAQAEQDRAEARRQADFALKMQIHETQRQQEETKRQASIAVEQLFSSHGHGVRAWADDVIETIGRSISLCFCKEIELTEQEFVKERSNVVQRLSALVDRGKLFFPNVDHDQYGTHKPAAYQGIRQAVLDDIIDAHDATRDSEFSDPQLYLRDLIEARREFVSEIQQYLDPRAQQQRLRQLAGEAPGSAEPASRDLV